MEDKKKVKMSKDIVPEDFTLGLAIFDAFPVIFFGIAVLLLGKAMGSWLFFIGALLCFWAGLAKVVWKIVVVKKHKNIWWMFMQMRIFMPIGFVSMILAVIVNRKSRNVADIIDFATSYPVSVFFIICFAGLVLMGVAASKLDSSDLKSNWIEQTINLVAQLSFLLGVILISMAVGYYTADETANQALVSDDTIQVQVNEDEVIFTPTDTNAKVGLIFYPGGKVEYTAYAPLVKSIAKQGVVCVLPKMPLNLVMFDSNKADDIMESMPEIEKWYMAGHSMGGAFGSMYASKNVDKLSGIVLISSYSTKTLKDLPVLCIYGSNDQVMNRENYKKYKSNLPNDYKEVMVEGGNHAMFGNYGAQDGDGEGTISASEQQSVAVEAIKDFISAY